MFFGSGSCANCAQENLHNEHRGAIVECLHHSLVEQEDPGSFLSLSKCAFSLFMHKVAGEKLRTQLLVISTQKEIISTFV